MSQTASDGRVAQDRARVSPRSGEAHGQFSAEDSPRRRWVIAAPLDRARSGRTASDIHYLIVSPSALLIQRAAREPAANPVLGSGDFCMFPAAALPAVQERVPLMVLCEIGLPPAVVKGDSAMVVRRLHPLTVHLARRIHELERSGDASAQALSASFSETLRLHLIERLAEGPSGDPAVHGLKTEQRDTLLDYIDRCRAGGDLRLSALAGHLGMSVGAFRNAFEVTFQTTPHQFVLDRRIDRAKLLLTGTDTSITEISVNTGFATPSHFSTAFKARVGMTPSRYRSARR